MFSSKVLFFQAFLEGSSAMTMLLKETPIVQNKTMNNNKQRFQVVIEGDMERQKTKN